ncbi:MAG: hypothetical protein COB29_15690 [Sulfitobacter sp.]|nr:MAG: hypothetical protein COB29_15690 [Sulfitobacter sp.]
MYKRELATHAEVINMYRAIVASIGWIAKQVGPSLAHAHSTLGRAMHAPSLSAFQAAKHVMRFLKGHVDMSLQYTRPRVFDWRNGDLPQWHMQTDASLADDVADRKSQGGYVGNWEDMAASTFSSTKSPRVCTSTYQAESAHATNACKEIEYKRNLFRFLRVLRETPTILEVDNYATFLSAGAPIRKFSPRSKQFSIEESTYNSVLKMVRLWCDIAWDHCRLTLRLPMKVLRQMQ